MKPKTKTKPKGKPAPVKPSAGVVKLSPGAAAKPERHAVARLEHEDKGNALTSGTMAALYMAPSTNAAAVLLPFYKSPFGVKTLKHTAIELLRAEFSEQIRDEPPSEQAWLAGMNEALIAYACAEMRRRHGRRQGRHSEP